MLCGLRFIRFLADNTRHVLKADDAAKDDLPAAQETEEEQEHRVLTRQRSLGLRSPAELLVDPLERVGRAQRLPLRGRVTQEREELVTGLVEARDHGLAAKLPLPHESDAGLLHRRAILTVDHPPVVLGELLPQVRGRLREQVPQLVIRAALDVDLGPGRPQSRLEPGIPIDHRDPRQSNATLDQRVDDLRPRCLAILAGDPQIEYHSPPVLTGPERHQHGYAHPLLSDSHPRIPAVQEQVDDLLLREIPPRPGLEVSAQPADQPRDRVLRQRRPTQQRRQRPSHSPRVRPRQVDSEQRLVDSLGAPLVTPHYLASPLAALPVSIGHASARHRERRRSEARRKRPLSRPVSVARTLRSHALRLRGPKRRVELLLHQLLDRLADPFPHHHLDRVTPELLRFFLHPNPAIASHGVILRPPTPSGCEFGSTRRRMTPFSFFHQLRDTTASTSVPLCPGDSGAIVLT